MSPGTKTSLVLLSGVRTGFKFSTMTRSALSSTSVSMYLTEANVRDFFRDISSHASAGSEIVFDHFNPFFDPPNNEANARLVAMLKSWGEPWIFAIPDGKEKEFLAASGLTLTGHTSMLVTSADARRYIVRQDGSAVGDVVFPAPNAAPGRTVHWLARAKVAGR